MWLGTFLVWCEHGSATTLQCSFVTCSIDPGRNDNSSTIRGGKIEWRRSFPRRSNRLRRIHRYYPVEDDAEDAEVIICPARADLMRDTALKEARQFSEGSAGRQEGLGCANGCVEEGAQGATRRCRESTSPWSLLVRGQKAKGKEPAPWAVKGFEHMMAYTDVRPQRQPLELSFTR